MPNPEPKVSIIMPTFNGARFIKRSIGSVLSQAFKDFELIIINDGSTDNTRQVIKRCRDKRIVYIENKKNLGVPKARNIGLRCARGEYIAYCDHDDIYYPGHLKVLSDFLDSHPDIGLVYADSLYIFPNGKREIKYSVDFDKNLLEIGNFILTVEVMHRKECLGKAGLFDENRITKVCSSEDWDMWLRISDDYKCFHLNKVLSKFVFHKTNRTYSINFYISYEYVIRKRFNKLRKRYQRLRYIRSYAINHVWHLLEGRNFKAAYKIAKKFYITAKTPHSTACLGLSNLARGNFKVAIKYFQKSIQGFSRYKNKKDYLYRDILTLLKVSLASAFSSLGYLKAAEEQLKDAYSLALTANQNRLYRYGFSLLKKDVRERLALLYAKSGLYNQALGLTKDCRLLSQHYIQGICYFGKGLYKKAIIKFKKYIELNKKSIKEFINLWSQQKEILSFGYFNLGLAYLKLKKNVTAKMMFKRALRLNPYLFQVNSVRKDGALNPV